MIVELPFVALPTAGGDLVERPAVYFGVGSMPVQLLGLVDTGAFRVRLNGSLASELGIAIDAVPPQPLVIGGVRTLGHDVDVLLDLAGYAWSATVTVCVPDFAPFQLLGLTGFLDRVHVCVDAYRGRTRLEPHEHRLVRLGA